MKTIRKIEGSTTYFVITELNPEYYQAVLDLSYFRFKDNFAKDFPSDTPNLDQIYGNFERYSEEMVLQAAKVHEVSWRNALTTFFKMIQDKNIDWWLTGSTALAVRGIDVLPGDIDIVVAEEDCERLGEILLDYVVEPILPCEDWIADWFGRAFIDARLEWVGSVNETLDTPAPSDFGPTATEMLEIINWEGFKIRVPPIELQRQVSERRGLIDRVEKIQRYQQR